MKSILVHVADDPCLQARIQVALDLGRSFDAHITFLQTIPLISIVPIDVYGASVADVMPKMREVASEVRKMTEKQLKNEDVAWDWVTVEGRADERILSVVNAYDLLVLGACDPFEFDTPRSSLAASMAVNSNGPVLVVPRDHQGLDCTMPAMIAWDGSVEASRAVRAAVPMLKHAKEVSFVSVQEKSRGRTYDLPAINGAQYLSRHGVQSEIVQVDRNGQDTAECLVNAAQARGAGYLVMGAYGYSRLRESLLGGVTRDMLTDPQLPILLHH